MKRLITIILSIVFIIASFSTTIAQDTDSMSVIYLLDVSGSMNEEGLFDNIKQRLKTLISERKVGDRVIIGVFSDDVRWPVQYDISDDEDINEIKEVIDDLKAKGNWTWLSEAFKQTKEKADDIRKRFPKKSLMLYILTDCINDPPPRIKRIEPTMSFIEVLRKYFEGFSAEDTFIYLLSYGPLSPPLRDSIRVITDPIVPRTPTIPKIKLSFTEFDSIEVELSKEETTQIDIGEITIEEFQDVSPIVNIELSPPESCQVKPTIIEADKKGQIEKISITIPSNLEPGNYKKKIKLSSEEAIVEPPQLTFSFTIPESKNDFYSNLIGIMVSLLFIILVLTLLDAFIRSKTIWVKKLEDGKTEEIDLKGWKRFYLGEKPSGKYDFGLPKHFIRRVMFKKSIFIQDEGGEKIFIVFNEDVHRNDVNGNKITLQFSENKPDEEIKIPKNKEDDTGIPIPTIWDKIDGKK